jgi:ADP-ribose pyrophosphatase YjhB (NUDIX family)
MPIEQLADPLTPLSPKASWQSFAEPRPYPCVIGFAFDARGYFPAHRRSETVRSAKGRWSLPSGLHEVGYTLEQQFCVELAEELNLTADPADSIKLGVYEAILPDDNWHWVMNVMAARVDSLSCMLNREPEKHPVMKIFHVDDLENLDSEFYQLEFTPYLGETLRKLGPKASNWFKRKI